MAHSTHCCDFDGRVSQEALGYRATLVKVKRHIQRKCQRAKKKERGGIPLLSQTLDLSLKPTEEHHYQASFEMFWTFSSSVTLKRNKSFKSR